MSTLKNLNSIKIILMKLMENGSLKPEQFETAVRNMKALEHALQIKDLKKIKIAVDKIARQFLK